ncbi:Siroheme synthase [compost metagenome]
MSHVYPVLLNIKEKACLVIGGGRVAERKITSLLDAGAKVTVISPIFSHKLQAWGAAGRIVLTQRGYELGDVHEGLTLVIAATDVEEVNRSIYRDAAALHLWVQVADQPDISTFILPSVVRKGKLILAVSTGGASPTLARQIASEWRASYGDEYEIYLEFLADLRLKVQSWVKDKEVRQQMFKQMLEWDVLAMIRCGLFESWKTELLEALKHTPTLDMIELFTQVSVERLGGNTIR